jgi:hypothetical protein
MLSAEQALKEFIELTANVLEKPGIDAHARTAELKTYIELLLQKHQVDKERRLIHSGGHLDYCKL